MASEEKLMELYLQVLPDGTPFEDAQEKLSKVDHKYQADLRCMLCDELLYAISMGYIKYSGKNLEEVPLVKILCQQADLLPQEKPYFKAVSAMFRGEYEQCLELLKRYFSGIMFAQDKGITEFEIVDWLFEPFKNAFPGFWRAVAKLLAQFRTEYSMIQLCEMIDTYYSCRTDEDALELLLNYEAKYPDVSFTTELIGYTYFSLKKWHNALAAFEQIEERNIFLRYDHLYFLMGYCSGKVKDKIHEEQYYRKCLEYSLDHIDALNNLGYCLYQQKRYAEAADLFAQCLEIDVTYTYAANNLAKTLIAQGKHKDAKELVRKDYKISMELKKKIALLEDKNVRLQKNAVIVEQTEAIDDDTMASNVDLGLKREQFSSEKLLEDELTARLEAGMDVFGLKLKIFRRKGLYGRQFRIPVGRLDLLCEDAEGNLYIIELKKDSGYDDAYEQTIRYLDWFDHSEYNKGRKIYGIICLNSPSRELIEKVHSNSRIKLFEYQISYREI